MLGFMMNADLVAQSRQALQVAFVNEVHKTAHLTMVELTSNYNDVYMDVSVCVCVCPLLALLARASFPDWIFGFPATRSVSAL